MSEILKIHDLHFRPYIPAEKIDQKVKEMAAAIYEDFAEKEPVFLAILNGSFIFAADIVRYFPGPCVTSFIKLASYQGLNSTGEINTLIGLNIPLKDRHVVILEDIVDSGLTMQNLLFRIGEMEPASVAVASLLLKPDELAVPLEINYLGFEIPSLFVVGYGMDYNEFGRNLPGIWQLTDLD